MAPAHTAALSEAAKACKDKMVAAKVSEACQRAFLASHRMVEQGSTGCITEASITPATDLPDLNHLPSVAEGSAVEQSLLGKTVVMKLNGGLGTGMGLDQAKSLLHVKNNQTFLDFIVKHVESIRQHATGQRSVGKKGLRFMLMNSFSTKEGTTAFLRQHYASLAAKMDSEVELMQNQVPKVLQDSLKPATWPSDPKCEWVPPGHGDLYAALYGSGKLDQLLREGFEFMFVSNSDNLGATIDTRILQHMSSHPIPFIMEVCRRTEGDKKGGHLARAKEANPALFIQAKALLLRESVQCPPEETSLFQDIHRHGYFNTNNLWIHLPALKSLMETYDGMLPLSVIRNAKTLDPSDATSPKVFQLETAMGAAISLFNGAAAVIVPRERFTPVKTCADLLALRSDAYVVTPDHRLILHPARKGKPPVVTLDDHYKLVKEFEELVLNGVPSLLQCDRVTVRGLVQFGGKGIVLKGSVIIENRNPTKVLIVPPGTVLENTTFSG